MSTFWSGYIIFIVVLNIFGCAALLMWTRKMDISNMPADGTTGHEYDGIREYNKPLPQWWLILFWLTIASAIAYLTLYPGLGNFKGTLGWTSLGELNADEAAYQSQYGALYAGYAKVPIEQLATDTGAMKIGGRLFANNCATCHGADAKGARGFPNLTDNDWLYGGSPDRIVETIMEGRNGVMPAWGETLGETGVADVTAYVQTLAGRKVNAAKAQAGATQFALCAACHGANGSGNPLIGAPNLNDNVWLHGSNEAAIMKTIYEGRQSHMPAQKHILGAERVHILAAYVYSLSHKP